MTENQIVDAIYDTIDSFYTEGEYYNRYNEDGKDICDELEGVLHRLRNENEGFEYDIFYSSLFYSVSYKVGYVAIAWSCGHGPHLETIHWEVS